jgi:hypothetical protein
LKIVLVHTCLIVATLVYTMFSFVKTQD